MDIIYVGVNDHYVDLFEGQYKVPNGMSYNSYVIMDEKIAVMDTVEKDFGDEWLKNIENAVKGRKIDYLIIQHVEPDHSSNIKRFMEIYKETTIVSKAQSFPMIKNFYGDDYKDRRIEVKEGDTLSLGKHTLNFIEAPMVHWPEVIMTYDSYEKALFSADGFGKFGALDVDEPWEEEARRYYIGIVGKYGVQVQNVLKKAANLDIKKILPLHGPILEEDLGRYLALYDTWSSYGVEKDGILVCYTSVYGNTKAAVELLVSKLKANGTKDVKVFDLARSDMSEAVANAFAYGRLVLATTTYNGEIYPYMREFIENLRERGFKNRTIGFIENGTWAPQAAKKMKSMLDGLQNINYLETTVKIMSSLSDESRSHIDAMVYEITN